MDVVIRTKNATINKVKVALGEQTLLSPNLTLRHTVVGRLPRDA